MADYPRGYKPGHLYGVDVPQVGKNYTVGGVAYDHTTGQAINPDTSKINPFGYSIDQKTGGIIPFTKPEPPKAPNAGRGEVRQTPGGGTQTGTNTGFKLDLAGHEAFQGAAIVDPFAAGAKPTQTEHGAEVMVGDKSVGTSNRYGTNVFGGETVDFTQPKPGIPQYSKPHSGGNVDFTADPRPFSHMGGETKGVDGEIKPKSGDGSTEFDISEHSGESVTHKFDMNRRRAFLDADNSIAGIKAVRAGKGLSQVGGAHYIRKGDEMVKLDMANYGTGDQGFYKMKRDYMNGQIDAQTFLAGKTAEVKQSLTDSTPDPANSQQPNFQAPDMSRDSLSHTPEIDSTKIDTKKIFNPGNQMPQASMHPLGADLDGNSFTRAVANPNDMSNIFRRS